MTALFVNLARTWTTLPIQFLMDARAGRTAAKGLNVRVVCDWQAQDASVSCAVRVRHPAIVHPISSVALPPALLSTLAGRDALAFVHSETRRKRGKEEESVDPDE